MSAATGGPASVPTIAAQDANYAMPATDKQHTTDDLGTVQLEPHKHTKTPNRPSDPVYDVLNLPELHERILTHLPIKDLTRALTVFQQWRKVVIGSIKLRRTLFLEPCQAKDYLSPGENKYAPVERRKPNIVHERVVGLPSPRYLSTTAEKLKAVSPSTLLFQPPVEQIRIHSGLFHKVTNCTGGVTFGTLIEEVELLVRCHNQNNDLASGFDRGLDHEIFVSVTAYDTVSEGAADVIHARWKLLHVGDTTQPCPCGYCRQGRGFAT
ncbi:hypothetical protein E2P81_ATG10478 [Venturia nashicola]|nr:hypothetical protein E2P81_ATG10478 [Venturia nashicola]